MRPERIGDLVHRLRELERAIVVLVRDAKDLLPDPLRGQAAAVADTHPDQTGALPVNALAEEAPSIRSRRTRLRGFQPGELGRLVRNG